MREKIKQYMEQHKEEMLEDIRALVRIDSARGEASEGKPFGEGPAKAIAVAEEMAKKYNLSTKNFDNYVLTINSSEGEAELGILAHLDIVPVGTGWTKNPLDITIEGNKIYGRGTSDDKGPAVTAIYALRAIKELGIPLSKNIRIILGSDEECGSGDLKYYFQKENPPKYCFTPDAEFPIINGEKGGYGAGFTAEYDVNEKAPCIVSINGGHTSNVVPNTCVCIVKGISMADFNEVSNEMKPKLNVEINVKEINDTLEIEISGKSAHASTPDKGINAVTAALEIMSKLPLADCKSTNYIKAISAIFPHNDFYGEAAGIAMEDEIMGKLTCSFDIFNMENGKVFGKFDIRSPQCSNEENTSKVLAKKLADNGLMVNTTKMNEPHYVSEDLPFIKVVKNVYENATGLEAKCECIGGGTYVHHIENGIAFGPTLPGTDTKIHQADEFSLIDELVLGARIYAEIIAEICK